MWCELHAILEDQGWGALQLCMEHEVLFELFWHDGGGIVFAWGCNAVECEHWYICMCLCVNVYVFDVSMILWCVHLKQLLLLSLVSACVFVRAMENLTNNDHGLPPTERLRTALGPVLFSVLLIFSSFVLVAFCVCFCCCLGVFECLSVWLFLPFCLLCFMVSVKLWTGFVFCVVCVAFLSCGLTAKCLG